MSGESSRRYGAGLVGVLFLLSGSSILASSQSGRTLIPEGEILESFRRSDVLAWGRWDWGKVVGIEDNDSKEPFAVIAGREGRVERVRLAIPEAGYMSVRDISGGPDGALAFTGSADMAGGRRGGFVAWISPDRQRQVVVQTWPFFGDVVAVAADGNIWTAGFVIDEANDRNTQYNVFKRFDISGKILATFAIRARGRPGMGKNGVHVSTLRASPDRIGWLTNAMEYIEFSLDGRQLNRFPPPAVARDFEYFGLSLAMNGKDNQVLTAAKDKGRLKVWALDRETAMWVPLQLGGDQHPEWELLMGFDSGALLVADEHWHTHRYRVSGGIKDN